LKENVGTIMQTAAPYSLIWKFLADGRRGSSVSIG